MALLEKKAAKVPLISTQALQGEGSEDYFYTLSFTNRPPKKVPLFWDIAGIHHTWKNTSNPLLRYRLNITTPECLHSEKNLKIFVTPAPADSYFLLNTKF